MNSPIWNSIVNPSKYVEVKAWIKNKENVERIRNERGSNGESIIHWASVSEKSVLLDLISLDFDINDKDSLGRTPLDFAFQRLYMVFEEDLGKLTELNKKKLRVMSDDLISVVIRMGGEPNHENDMKLYRLLAARYGLWEVLFTFADRYGLDSFVEDIGCVDFLQSTMLHELVVAPTEESKEKIFKLMNKHNVDMNVKNRSGQTALYLAARGFFENEKMKMISYRYSMEKLVENGASMEEHIDGLPLFSIMMRDFKGDSVKSEVFMNLIDYSSNSKV